MLNRLIPSYHYRYDNTENDEHSSGGNDEHDYRSCHNEEKEGKEKGQRHALQQLQWHEQDDDHQQG